MGLKEKINDDMKTAMKSGEKLRLETIRSIRALILEFEKSGVGRELNPDDELKMLTSAVKKRKDSIEQYENAGRNDLADKEKAELSILLEYLPKQLTTEEIEQEIVKMAKDLGVNGKEGFPVLMPQVMKIMKGKADGKIVKSLVEKALGII